MKNHRLSIIFLSLICSVVLAGTIKVWASGEALTAAKLNANFAHIHNLMVGGHGARLVDTDISPTANISTTKLAAGPLIPKAWATISSAACTTATCTIDAQNGVTSITRSALGVYSVTLSATVSVPYAVMVSSGAGIGGTPVTAANVALCTTEAIISSSTIAVDCWKNDGTGAQDTGFTIVVLDN